MHLFLASLFVLCLACPLLAQKPQVRDSMMVLSLLKEGQLLMQNEKTKIIASQYFGDAFRLSESLGFYKGQGESLRALGMLDVRDKHQYSSIAMNYFKKSLVVWELYQDIPEIAHTFSILGDVFSEYWKLPKEALAYYKQALTLTEKLGKDAEKYEILLKIFKIHIAIEEIQDAVRYSRPLIAYHEKQGAYEEVAKIKLAIVQYWATQKEFEKAKVMAKEAQNNFQAQGGDSKQFETHMNAIKHSFEHTTTLSTSRISIMVFTALVLILFFVGSYFYARRQVAKKV